MQLRRATAAERLMAVPGWRPCDKVHCGPAPCHVCRCRCLHNVLHRLMLQLLSSHFPGSYLIRAQEGELRYLAAFNSPTAAAAWCITLHVSWGLGLCIALLGP